MPQIRPITDLRSTTEISNACHANMSIETYEEMLETAVDAAISDAEAEFTQDGKLHDAREAFSSFRRKYFG